MEEFLTNGIGLGYNDVKAGESFVKIGVGAVRKPEEAAFQQFRTYEITTREVDRQGFSRPRRIHQELSDTAGYAYLYKKTVRLAKDKPQLCWSTASRIPAPVIETSVYDTTST